MENNIESTLSHYVQTLKEIKKEEIQRDNALKELKCLYKSDVVNFECLDESVPANVIIELSWFFSNGSFGHDFLLHSANKKLKEKELFILKEKILDDIQGYMQSFDFYLSILKRIKERKPNASGDEIITYFNQALYMIRKNKRNEDAEVYRLVRLIKNNE